MELIEQEYIINAPLDAVWRALTDAGTITKWSGAPAIMDDEEGTKFNLWNGDIHGMNIEVTENDELIQEWYGGKWDKPSKVTITLTQSGLSTKVHLLHEYFPEDELESLEDGWREYYFTPLKEFVENELV